MASYCVVVFILAFYVTPGYSFNHLSDWPKNRPIVMFSVVLQEAVDPYSESDPASAVCFADIRLH